MATPSVTVTANKFDPNTQSFVPTSAPTNVVPTNQTATTITSDSLKTPEIVPLATPNTPDYASTIATTLADLTNAQSTEQAKVDATRNEAKTESSNIANLQSLLGGKGADTQKIYNEQGVTKAYNQIKDINAQATGLLNESKAIPIQVQNEYAGRGTLAGQEVIASARLRDNALKALSLGQQAAIATADYDKAKNYADMIVNAKYDQMEADIKAKLTNLESIKDFDLTPAEKKLAETTTQRLKYEEAQVAERKKNELDIQNMVISAASQQAPSDLVEKAKKAATPSEAAIILGAWAGDYWSTKTKIADYYKKTSGGSGEGGSSSGLVTTPGQSVAESWLAQYNSGAMSLEDIYTKIGSSKTAEATKNELSKLIAAQGGKRVLPMDDAQVAGIDEQIKNINDLVGGSGYNYKVISGLSQGGLLGVGGRLTGAKGDALAIARNLVSNQTLQSLADAKAKGVTFGALSEAELNAVANAASRVASKVLKDESGQIIGFSGSESGFKADLLTIKSGLEKSKLKKTGNNLDSKIDTAVQILNQPENNLGGFQFK